MKSAVAAGGAYFILVFAAGFMAGTVRVLILAPLLGRVGAVIIELPVMLGISWLVCGWAVRRFEVPARFGIRVAMGAVAFALLMTAELGVSELVFGRSLVQHFDAYRSLDGAIGLIAQFAFGAFPVARLFLED